jgi:hypothetical protein
MPGARCTRSRAWWVVNTRVSHHGRTGITRHSRTRMVLTVYFVLSLVTGLSCHHRPQEALLLENLTPASGRQDHTTSPSARIALSSVAQPASIASQPYVRDDRETPLCVGRDGERYGVIWSYGVTVTVHLIPLGVTVTVHLIPLVQRLRSSTSLRFGRLRPTLARLEGAPGQSLKPGEKAVVPERSANALGRTQAGEQFRLRLAGKQIGEAGVTLPDGRQRR